MPIAWPNRDHGLVCGPCKALVNWGDYGSTCNGYCEAIGLACNAAWEEQADTCRAAYPLRCDETLSTSDAICECGTPRPPTKPPPPPPPPSPSSQSPPTPPTPLPAPQSPPQSRPWSVIATRLITAGEVTDFYAESVRNAIAERFAAVAAVAVRDVSIQVLPASVAFVIAIAVPESRSSAALTAVQLQLKDATTATAFLAGVAGLDIQVALIDAPPAMMPDGAVSGLVNFTALDGTLLALTPATNTSLVSINGTLELVPILDADTRQALTGGEQARAGGGGVNAVVVIGVTAGVLALLALVVGVARRRRKRDGGSPFRSPYASNSLNPFPSSRFSLTSSPSSKALRARTMPTTVVATSATSPGSATTMHHVPEIMLTTVNQPLTLLGPPTVSLDKEPRHLRQYVSPTDGPVEDAAEFQMKI